MLKKCEISTTSWKADNLERDRGGLELGVCFGWTCVIDIDGLLWAHITVLDCERASDSSDDDSMAGVCFSPFSERRGPRIHS